MFVADLIMGIAPTIAKKLGGLFHDKAANAIKSATGIDIGSADASERLQNLTPEQIAALKQKELDFYKVETEDVQNARQREVYLADTKWGWIPILVQNLGAIAIMAILILLNVYAVFMHPVDPQDRSQIFTSDIAIIMLLVGYWWGKSQPDKT